MVKKKVINLEIRGVPALLLTLIFSVSLISAVGVATSYWEDNPLKLAPGESTIVSVRLQSEGEETTLKATLDSPIAELVDGPEYTIPVGVENVPVNIKVKIPADAEIGAKYNIFVSFQEISSGEGGMLRVAQGITSKLPVEVVGEQESALAGQKEKSGNKVIWIILALIVLFVIFFALKNKRKK